MKVFVVNLERSKDRRKYMEDLLKDYKSLDVEFINGIDGNNLTDLRKKELFDIKRYEKTYLKKVRDGEIGCTLSHQKIYRTLLDSPYQYSLVFEDDLEINMDLNTILPDIEKWLMTDEPRVLLLSGWFWYSSSKIFIKDTKICNVIGAYLTHGYALNKAAAELMIDERPWYVADAWNIFKKRGIRICGLTPHPCDQDWSGVFNSEVLIEPMKKSKFFFKSWLQIKTDALVRHLSYLINHFEPVRNQHIREQELASGK